MSRDRTLKPIDELREDFPGPMSPAELEFLRDLQGLVEYVIRNGLSFRLVVTAVGHDINGLRRYGYDLEQAEKDGFTPMVSGYADASEDAVGELEETNGSLG